ncbi:MAG: hypothetical protein OHK0022_29290 [Roseiflexaceae bacterium]
MNELTPEEQLILAGVMHKANFPGYNPSLDLTDEERRIAVKHLARCLADLSRLGVRISTLYRPPDTGARD